MKIRAKFFCTSVQRSEGYPGEFVQLYPVTDEDPDNKTWSEATPAGLLELTIDNPDAQGQFKVGRAYYLDITPA